MVRRLIELVNKNFFSSLLTRKTTSLPVDQLPLITISRESGSGGRLIAYLVAKKLGMRWRIYHKEIIDEIATQTKLEKELIREVDEKKIPLIEKLVDDLFGKRYLTLGEYYKNLVRILTTIGHRGYAIIVGRGANFFFPHALKVRIICEMTQRIEWEMQYEKLSRAQAVKRIEKSDSERDEFIRVLFHHDQRKAHHYDLIIRTGKSVSLNDAASLIVQMTKKKFRL